MNVLNETLFRHYCDSSGESTEHRKFPTAPPVATDGKVFIHNDFPLCRSEGNKTNTCTKRYVESFLIATFPTTLEERFSLLVLDTEIRSKSKIIKYFLSKLLWEGLSDLEFEAFILFSLNNRDDLSLEVLKHFKTSISTDLLRKRINAFFIFKGLKPLSNRYWLSIKPLIFKLRRTSVWRQPRKPEKYSGWRRHQNDQGSLSPNNTELFRQDTTEIFMSNKDILISVLTVGSMLSGSIGSVEETSLTSALMKAETVRFNSIIKEVLFNENL